MTPLPFDHDTDGDGCTDWYELGPNPELGGLSDPFNPNDCSVQLTPDGLYEISHEFAGGYRRCMGAVNTSLDMDVYCYTDIAGVPVNPVAFGSISGDGLPGAPPPGPEATPYPSGFPNLVYGHVPGAHTQLSGSYNAATNEVTFTGCFEDPSRADALAYIRVEWTWNVQTGAGTSKAGPGISACPGGVGSAVPLQAMKLATTQQMAECYTPADPDCAFADNDGDGVPDHRELRDDRDVNDPDYPNVPAPCGLRDPFNPCDYYDVSIPRDGAIDLFADISLVIANFEAGGYDQGDPAIEGPGTMENYDRPAVMTGGMGWNRGDPDGVINLFDDISGVIAQFNPGGCSGP